MIERRHIRPSVSAAAAWVAAAIALSGCATVDADDLGSYVDQLHSTAAQGALLARKAAENGRPPATFTWLESAELTHQAGQLLEHLDGRMIDAGVKAHVDEAQELGKRIENALIELHDGANDRGVAAAVLPRLRGQAEATEKLYEELQ